MIGDSASRRYRKPTWFRWTLVALTATCVGGTVWAGAVGMPGGERTAPAFLFAMFALLVGLQAEFARRYRLTIDDRGFEITEWRRPSRFELDQVRGFRRHCWNNRLTVFVELRAPGERPVPIPVTTALDAAFDAWAARMPELDGTPGAPGPRADAFGRDRVTARWVNWLSIATSIWALAYPRPYAVAIALPYLTPVIAMAIVRWGRGRFTLEGERTPVPSLFLALVLPGIIAGLGAIGDLIHLVRLADVALPAVGCGVAVGGLTLLADPRLRRTWSNRIGIVVACSWIYAGALLIVNRAMDASPPATYRAVVLDKWVGRGRGGGPTLALGPWGPRAERDATKVPWDVYGRARVGGSITVLLRPGWLGMAWFAVE